MSSGVQGNLRLAELIGTISLATDLGLGLHQQHMLNQCRIALRLGELAGAGKEERAAAYYVALMAWVGCTSDSHEIASKYGDDLAFRAESYLHDLDGFSGLFYLLERAGTGRSPLLRASAVASVLANRGDDLRVIFNTHCMVASGVAGNLGLGDAVSGSLRHIFERWDGRGVPDGISGDELPLPVRLVQIADFAEVHHFRGGITAAIEMVRKHSGTRYDPELVETFTREAPGILGELGDDLTWQTVLASEPTPWRHLAGEELDHGLETFADFIDIKSAWFTGHSRRVSKLAAAAGEAAGLPGDDVTDLRRAGLVHDLGRTGVSTLIWNKRGSLSPAEIERVRMNPYFTQRVLAQAPALARVGEIAAAAYERLDGSGYHRGINGSAISPTMRVLAAADCYQAMVEDRPHRPALSPEQARKELEAEARAGRLDADAVRATLEAAGHRATSQKNRAGIAGLTKREIEVLVLIANGASAKEIANRLVISVKTARNHTERIYSKLGVSSRSEATIFAMRHGLVS